MKTIGRYFDKLWNWVVYSSANPAQISSTIKWAGGVLATILTVVLGFGHLSFPAAEFTVAVDYFIQSLQMILLGLTTLGTCISALRKIYLTLRRENVKTVIEG